MPEIPNHAPVGSDAVQTAVVRSCEVCSGHIQGERTATCSDRCRAERWRRGRDRAQRDRDAQVMHLLREVIDGGRR
jgi:predicted nucleic acid-binding Zn ribbon protein